MKVITRTVRVYRCDVCKTEYEKEADAKKCEARLMEGKLFKKGDIVANKEPRLCDNTPYFFNGTVTKIVGPEPTDEDYEHRWIRCFFKEGSGEMSRRLRSHVFLYVVEYMCPMCEEKKDHMYYTPEIEQ